MGIRLVFTFNREVFRLEVVDRKIWYFDRKWNKQIKLIPKDEEFILKIIKSRNKIPAHFINLFNLTKEEKEEYDMALTDEALADVCITDVRKKGAVLQQRELI